ncbi:uncharacterized protein LODBEIA_P04430 [Lodderomyces beijingensis]|uniref:Zn(2)-C6 fungal-type domain-containing protein n=1 Tax=Lodderomyces beijingensis TaxID=1775926 RepID=A0ABP0ZDG1_9ASCO
MDAGFAVPRMGLNGSVGGSISGGVSQVPTQIKDELANKLPKLKSADSRMTAKTIRAPGSRAERVAQACDRCRAKKTKCDGGDPCSTCSAVGMKCIVSDKLSRKAFPKGYTETLEERVRHLEAENKKLTGLLDMRGEQLEILNNTNSQSHFNGGDELFGNHSQSGGTNGAGANGTGGSTSNGGVGRITARNLQMLQQENIMRLHMHDHGNGCSCGCTNEHAVHDRPVSVAGSLFETGKVSIAGSIRFSDDEDEDGDDNDSLLSADEYQRSPHFGRRRHFASNSTNRESSPAPGAFAAATAIAQMQKNKSLQEQRLKLENETNKQRMLTSLVATSMPRSTEETLCVPTLLARICQAYGYDSQPSLFAANTLASLKDHPGQLVKLSTNEEVKNKLAKMIMNRDDVNVLPEHEAITFVRDLVKFPVSRLDLDQLLTVYFQTWGNTLPIIGKTTILNCYMRIIDILECSNATTTSGTNCSFESVEKIGAILVLTLSLGFLANKSVFLGSEKAQFYASLMKHYDFLINEFIKPNCLITKSCSIQSLQILSLALQYCLATGDIATCYELRGRVISIAQQLRLHRCPAAVLGVNTSNEGNFKLQNFMQAERRILFWCIYCLDTFSSLNMGVPRLMKDYEIECAMPFSGKGDSETETESDDDNVNILIINNTQLSIVGKVSRMSLSVMLFCKVLANILDSIYSRFDKGDTLHRDRMLESWRRELPSDLRFELDTNGLSLKLPETSSFEGNVWDNLNNQQLTLVYLYYHTKILIHLPIISKHGNHHNVGLSQKQQLTKGESDTATVVATMSVIQESSSQILEVIKTYTKKSSSPVLPIPLNIAREQALLTLLVAKGTLDYIKGGHLFNNSKQLVLDSVANLAVDSKSEVPGCITRNSLKLLELSVLSILGVNLNKFSNSLKKKPAVGIQMSKAASEREAESQKLKINTATTTTTTTSSSSFSVRPGSAAKILGAPNAGLGTYAKDEVIISAINQPSTNGSVQNQIGVTNKSIDHQSRNFDDMESWESLLRFDPFSITPNNQHNMMNDYVTDGSLGLVPFLEIPEQEDPSMNNQLFSSWV